MCIVTVNSVAIQHNRTPLATRSCRVDVGASAGLLLSLSLFAASPSPRCFLSSHAVDWISQSSPSRRVLPHFRFDATTAHHNINNTTTTSDTTTEKRHQQENEHSINTRERKNRESKEGEEKDMVKLKKKKKKKREPAFYSEDQND